MSIMFAELRRQEFERRRKGFDAVTNKKQQQRPRKKKKQDGKEGPKKRQRRPSVGLSGTPPMAALAGPGPGPSTSSSPTLPPSKPDEIDYAAIIEQIVAQVRQLPTLPLQEPQVETPAHVFALYGNDNIFGELYCFGLRMTCAIKT